MGDVDGEPVVLVLKRGADAWTPYSGHPFRRDRPTDRPRFVDYIHCPWVIEAATTVTIDKLLQI